MRRGIDYFPLDTSLDTKFELIEAEYGLTGFAVIVKLFQMIYGQEGYYCEVNDEVVLLFSRKIGLGGSTVSEIIRTAVRRGIFDPKLYEKYGVLTSEGIQKRYFDACKRREKIEVYKEYLLGNCNQNYKNVYISEKNVNNSSKNVYSSEQSKESKEGKESKERENTHTRHKYGIYKNVLLSDEELQAWESDCPVSREYIEKLSAYMASSGKSYKNYLATLRNWYRRDKEQGKVTVKRNASYDIDQAAKKAVEAVPTYERRKK